MEKDVVTIVYFGATHYLFLPEWYDDSKGQHFLLVSDTVRIGEAIITLNPPLLYPIENWEAQEAIEVHQHWGLYNSKVGGVYDSIVIRGKNGGDIIRAPLRKWKQYEVKSQITNYTMGMLLFSLDRSEIVEVKTI